MKFKTFKQNKLVRDKIVDIMQAHGSKLYWLTLQDKDFQKQLKIKLLEEAQEASHAVHRENMLEELADVLEVVHTLAQLYNITVQDLDAYQQKKREEKGGFSKRIFLSCAEHPQDSPAERYCLADPEKYPEVKQ